MFLCCFSVIAAVCIGCGETGSKDVVPSEAKPEVTAPVDNVPSESTAESSVGTKVDEPKTEGTTKSAKDESQQPEVVPSPASNLNSKETDIRVLAWNIESNGANPDVIAKQLTEMPEYDIYGFSEVRAQGFPSIKRALGEDKFYFSFTQSGYDDRLAYAIRKDRFDVVDQYEFESFKGHVINPGNYRSPFVLELKDKKTSKSFLVVLNHLARGKAEVRQQQALAIRMWAKDQGKPIIAIGDYNFDYVFDTDKGNRSMDVFLEDGTFKWIRPVPMVDSNYYDEDQDGVDDYIDSLLDFVFAAGDAKTWNMDCEVVVREGDFPDDQQTSDHRPVQLIIHP